MHVVFDALIYGHYSDYMFKRRIFTMYPEYFPPAGCVRSSIIYTSMTSAMVFSTYSSNATRDVIVSVLMVDPEVEYLPGQGYGSYDRGTGFKDRKYTLKPIFKRCHRFPG
jgi:hypothetical protein